MRREQVSWQLADLIVGQIQLSQLLFVGRPTNLTKLLFRLKLSRLLGQPLRRLLPASSSSSFKLVSSL